MSAVEWGVKRRCGKCETPFYDLLRDPIRCPKCGTVFRVEAAGPRSPSAARSSKARGVRLTGGPSRSPGPAPVAETPSAARADADADDADNGDEDADEAEPDSEDETDGETDGDTTDGDEAPRDR